MRTLGACGPQNALLRVYWVLLISQITWCPSVCPCLSLSLSVLDLTMQPRLALLFLTQVKC